MFADIELSNPRKPGLTSVKARALADTGALMLRISEHIAVQLNLETESMREVSVAGGRSQMVPYVASLVASGTIAGYAHHYRVLPGPNLHLSQVGAVISQADAASAVKYFLRADS